MITFNRSLDEKTGALEVCSRTIRFIKAGEFVTTKDIITFLEKLEKEFTED